VSRLGYLLLFPILSLPGCRFATASDDAQSVVSLRFVPSAFDSFTSNTEIRYTLVSSATVNLSVVMRTPAGDQRVNTLASSLFETKGSHAHTWLGDTGDGRFAPAGEYIGIIEIGEHRFEASVRVFHF